MAAGVLDQCPIRRARLDGAGPCRRCRAELDAIRRIADESAALAGAGLHRLAAGDRAAALRLIRPRERVANGVRSRLDTVGTRQRRGIGRRAWRSRSDRQGVAANTSQRSAVHNESESETPSVSGKDPRLNSEKVARTFELHRPAKRSVAGAQSARKGHPKRDPFDRAESGRCTGQSRARRLARVLQTRKPAKKDSNCEPLSDAMRL